MAADFDAGSIEGTLTLNTSPFEEGLRKAREQAREFGRQKITPLLDMDSRPFDDEMDRAEQRLDILGGTTAHAKLDLNDEEFRRRIDEDEARLDRLGMRSVSARAEVSGGGAPGGGGGGGMLDMFGGGGLMGPLIGLAAGVAPALAPGISALTLFGGAATAAFGGAAISLGLFAKVAQSDMKLIEKATSGPLLEAKHKLDDLAKSWQGLLSATSGDVGKTLGDAFGVAASILPRLVPLVDATAKGLDRIVKTIGTMVNSDPVFGKFLTTLEHFMKGFLDGAAPAITAVLDGMMRLFIGMVPVMKVLGDYVQGLTFEFDKWAESMQHGGIDTWFQNVAKYGPQLKQALGDLFHSLVIDIKALGPAVGPSIHLLDQLAVGLGKLAPFLHAIAPYFPQIALGIGALMSPLGKVVPLLFSLGDILPVLIGPVGLVAVGLGALAIAAVDAYKHSEPFRKSVQKLGEDIEKTWKKIQPMIATLKGPLMNAFQAVRNFIEKQVLPTLVQLTDWFVTKIVPIIVGAVVPVLRTLANVFTTEVMPAVVKFWKTGLEPLIQKLEPIITLVLKFAGYLIEKLLPPLIQVAGFIANTFLGQLTGVVQALTDIVTWAEKAGEAIGKIAGPLGKIGGGIGGAISGMGKGALGMLPGLAGGGTIQRRAGGGGTGAATLVGENGPELAFFPANTRIASTQNTRSMLRDALGGAGGGDATTLLRLMVQHLATLVAKTADPAEMVDSLGRAYAAAQEKSSKAIIQAGRAA